MKRKYFTILMKILPKSNFTLKVYNHSVDICFITETWLQDEISDSVVEIQETARLKISKIAKFGRKML